MIVAIDHSEANNCWTWQKNVEVGVNSGKLIRVYLVK